MSENIPLTSADGMPPSLQRVLSKLEAEPLAVNRDELFFQAGYAAGVSSLSFGERAGVRGQSRRHLWPAAAAALLLVSLTLAAALVHQSGFWRTRTHDSYQIATAGQIPRIDGKDERWQLLASPAAKSAGRLTATGWIETPEGTRDGERGVGNESQQDPPHDEQPLPLRPSSYLELMRLQLEG
jgi:hypothetical protein